LEYKGPPKELRRIGKGNTDRWGGDKRARRNEKKDVVIGKRGEKLLGAMGKVAGNWGVGE